MSSSPYGRAAAYDRRRNSWLWLLEHMGPLLLVAIVLGYVLSVAIGGQW